MMRRTITNLLARKIITLPRLSPTHTSVRLVERLVPSGSHVVEYQPILTVQCSSDMIADPADRVTSDHQPIMLLECMEEGTIQWNSEIETMDRSNRHQWLNVGTKLGVVDDEHDDEDGGEEEEEWAWQAYSHENNENGNHQVKEMKFEYQQYKEWLKSQ